MCCGQILEQLEPDSHEVSEKLEKILKHVQWQAFPGVQALLSKGCSNSVTAEVTWRLLSRLTTCLQSRIVAPDHNDGRRPHHHDGRVPARQLPRFSRHVCLRVC